VGPGVIFRIVEASRADPRYRLDMQEQVTGLSPGGITLEGRVPGLRITRLAHRFTALDGATQYATVLEVGFDAPVLGRRMNHAILRHRFPEDMGRAWIAQNIEEVGQLECFLPALHATRTER
jgi:hypothetical protein